MKINRDKVLQIIKWTFLAIYSFFAYELLLIPFTLEFGLLGVIISWTVLLLLFFIIPKNNRKQIAIYILLFILATIALNNIGLLVNVKRIFYFIIVLLVIYLVGKFYGNLSRSLLITLLVTAIVINITTDSDKIRLNSHFTQLWESRTLYTGNTVDYFPLVVRDVDHDGQNEIITFGHSEELIDLYEERLEKGLPVDKMPYDLEEEKLFLYVYKWDGESFERMDNEKLDMDEIRHFLPKDYIGFPYYVMDENFTLIPQVQLQPLAEQVGQFGAAPFYIFNKNVDALSQYLSTFDGVYDKKDSFRFDTDIQDISIVNGELIIQFDQQDTIVMETDATKIIDLIQLDGSVGLVLLSDQLEIWGLTDNGELALSHVLTEEQISNIMSSEYIIADIQNDGSDEILISAETSRIIKPLAHGEWDILFTSRDSSLRFEDFDTVGTGEEPSIIALAKSRLSTNPLRFLTSFTYTDDGLKQDWKSFISLINVQSVDVTGDGNKEIVATMWRSHKIYVFNKHDIPVTAILGSIFGLIVVYAIYWRRKQHEKI